MKIVTMIQTIYREFPNTEKPTHEDMFFWLMCSEKNKFDKLLGTIISKSSEITFISNPNNIIDDYD